MAESNHQDLIMRSNSIEDQNQMASTDHSTGALDQSDQSIREKNEESLSTVDQPLDKLTALEMLQLLKEYKKREFLYVFQITLLQKELYLKENDACSFPSSLVYHNAQVALLDPAVFLEVRELRLRLADKEGELQKARDELKASKFSADSVMGRRLINKCKALQEENTDIGKMLLENQLQPLQLQIGILQKQLAFFKKQLVILHQLNADLERDNQHLVRQLHEITLLYKEIQQERDQLKVALLQHHESSKHRDVDAAYSPRSSSRNGRIRSSSHHDSRRSSRKRSSDHIDDEHRMTNSRSGSHPHHNRRQSPTSRSRREEGRSSRRGKDRPDDDSHHYRRSRSRTRSPGGDSRRKRNESPSSHQH